MLWLDGAHEVLIISHMSLGAWVNLINGLLNSGAANASKTDLSTNAHGPFSQIPVIFDIRHLVSKNSRGGIHHLAEYDLGSVQTGL